MVPLNERDLFMKSDYCTRVFYFVRRHEYSNEADSVHTVYTLMDGMVSFKLCVVIIEAKTFSKGSHIMTVTEHISLHFALLLGERLPARSCRDWYSTFKMMKSHQMWASISTHSYNVLEQINQYLSIVTSVPSLNVKCFNKYCSFATISPRN